MSSVHRACKCGAVYDRSEHIVEQREISSCRVWVGGHRMASTALTISLIRSSRAALIPSMRDPFTTPLSMGASSPIDKVHCHSSMPP